MNTTKLLKSISPRDEKFIKGNETTENSNFERALQRSEKNDNCLQLKSPEEKKQIVDLFHQIQSKEQEYPEAYQMLHAQDSFFFAYQVLAKILYELINNIHYPKFKFLRYPNDVLTKTPSEFFLKYPTLHATSEEISKLPYEINSDDNDSSSDSYSSDAGSFSDEDQALNNEEVTSFLKDLSLSDTEESDDDNQINDTIPEISQEIISVSFALETYVAEDSALSAFLNGKGISQFSTSKNPEDYLKRLHNILKKLFEDAHISQSAYEPYLKKLIDNAPKTKMGIISQIFIPKDKIKNHIYMSYPGGLYRPDWNQHISEFLNDFQKSRQANNFNIKKNIQARLVAGSLFPSDIKIYRYTLIPKEERVRYKKFVLPILKEVLERNVEARNQNTQSQHSVTNLKI